MDIVYVLKNTPSSWDDNEIRYSLRSLIQYGKNYDHIYIIGRKPNFLDYNQITYIEYRDSGMCGGYDQFLKHLYMVNNTKVSENFIAFNEDFYLLQPINFINIPYYYKRERITTKYDCQNDFNNMVMETRALLLKYKKTIYDFESCYPIIYNKGKLKELERLYKIAFKTSQLGLSLRDLYGNWHYVPNKKLKKDNNIIDQYTNIDKFVEGLDSFSTNNIITEQEKKFLMNKYSDKCKWELYETNATKGHSDSPRIVCYTVITNNYDNLKQILNKNNDIDYVCFTDSVLNTEYKSGWLLKPIPPSLKNISKRKIQRLLKIKAHEFLSEYDISLYIDSDMIIMKDIKGMIDKYNLNENSVYIRLHPYHKNVEEEANAILLRKMDTELNINNMLLKYKQEGFPEDFKLYETGIILRRHNDSQCIKLMNLWATELLKGSHRDQMSLGYSQWATGVPIGLIDAVDYNRNYVNNKEYNNEYIMLSRHGRNKSIYTDKFPIVMVNFNNSMVTNLCIKSIIKNLKSIDYNIIVFDNSDKMAFILSHDIDAKYVSIVDNTKCQLINFEQAIINVMGSFMPDRYGSFNHCYTIQHIIDNIQYDKMILMDSDTILKRDIDFINKDTISVFDVENERIDNDKMTVKKRAVPFIQYFNIKLLKENNIKYFDSNRMHCGIKRLKKDEPIYDTGASFYEDIIKTNNYHIIDYKEYINHLSGGSWSKINERNWGKLNEMYL